MVDRVKDAQDVLDRRENAYQVLRPDQPRRSDARRRHMIDRCARGVAAGPSK